MKNLEDEYKRFNQEETPDLWNRIEAGLTDKKAKPKKNIFTFKYASVCAAAVLLALLLPSLYFMGLRGRNQAADTAPQNNMMPDDNRMPYAAGGSMNGAAAEDNDFLCEAEDGSAQEDGQMGDENADAAEQGEPETAERNEASGSIMQDANDTAEDMGQSGDKDSAPEENVSAAEPQVSGVIPPETENTAAQISGKMEVTDTEQKDGRMVYYLRMEDGRTVSAVLDERIEAELQTGKTYQFALKMSGEAAWEYVIEAAE